MAAYEVLLLNTAVPQIQAAQAGDTYVVPRDIAFSAALTLSAGTANGVPYLNGSKVLTTGSALTFDGTNLGVGMSPVGNGVLEISNSAGNNTSMAFYQAGSGKWLIGNTNSTDDLRFYNLKAGSEAMRLTSTGLGIGTSSPASKLHLSVASGSVFEQITSGSNQVYLGWDSVASMGTFQSSTGLTFATGGSYTERMALDSSGNLGLGVTPSAWGNFKALQISYMGIAAYSGGSGDASISWNAYNNGTNWLYGYTGGKAARYKLDEGTHSWYVTATNGTADNPITFSQAMTLDASGNFLVGNTSASFASGGGINVKNSSTSNVRIISGSNTGFDLSQDTSGNTYVYNRDNGFTAFATNNTERARITSGGNFKIGGSADRATTEGDKQLVLFDGTAPVGTLANGISIYSSSGEAYVMDAAGNATLFSPHDAVTNEWIFRSKHTPTGKVLKIDVERLLKFVNDHFGLDAVHEFIED